MQIQTKYNCDDNVFFLHNNKVIEGTVKKINIYVDNTILIKYSVYYEYKHKSLDENKIFSTKQELLESL